MAARVRWLLAFALLLLLASVYLVRAVNSGAPCALGADRCPDYGTVDVSGILDIPAAIVGALFTAIGAVVDALAAVAARVVGLLPDAGDLGLSVPSGWIVMYSWADRILPLHEALALFGIITATAVAPIVYHVAITVYHLIPKPFSGT